jgi:hypothetical protein
MKLRALLVAIFLLAPLAPSISATPPKAGAICKKLEKTQSYKGKTYTCVKSGKKLVWSKGSAATESAGTTVAPNPFATPFPDKFTRAEMVSSALENFYQYFDTNATQTQPRIVIDPKYQVNMLEIRNIVFTSYSALPFPQDYIKTIVVISNNSKFAEEQVRSQGFDVSDVLKASGGRLVGSAGYGWGVADFATKSDTPHEIFHVWQRASYNRTGNNNPDPNNPMNPPVWMDEGSADFFGYAIMRKISVRNLYPGLEAPRAGFAYQPLINYSTRNLNPNTPYALGRLATEYIVASVGWKGFTQIFFNVGAGQDFPDAFNNATGITLAEFYVKFDRNIYNMFG